MKPRKTAEQIFAFLLAVLENLEQPKPRIDPDSCLLYLSTMAFDAASLRNIAAYFNVQYPKSRRADIDDLMHRISEEVSYEEIDAAMEIRQKPDSLMFG